MTKNNKILTISGLEELSMKKTDNTVILCHGVFDLLHIGHIKYFEEAKSMGDILVVTLTPDKFVIKGHNRPVFNEKLRAEAISALDSVDFVAINEWSTAIETIQALRPDIYVKGPDYKYNKDITGNIELEEEAVKSVGGKIAFTSGQVFSSSNLINNFFNHHTFEQKKMLTELKKNYSIKNIYGKLDQLKDLRVLLVGETIIDEYIFCNSIGKSGKEPVLISKKLRSEKYAGGILSVANHVSDFCKEVKVLTYLGHRDKHSQFIQENLSKNIKLDYIEKSNSPTILKTRYVDQYSKTKIQGIYDINDENLTKSEERVFLKKLTNCIENYDIVIVVDYGHGLITSRIVNVLENQSKFLAVNTQLNSFNAAFHSISKYSKADYICVNSGELLYDYRNRNDEIESLTKMLAERTNSKYVVITLGKEGSMVYKGKKFIYCPAFAGKVVDRIGAGDTLLAITAICFAKNMDESLTIFLGNLSAAETIATTGTGNLLSKVKLLKTVETLLK